ncbi:ComF family protein [Alcanivorax sp. S6407]|uniref:ComF family protein n=1 Tax=Alcanivorax sp. S6407 TaxID=2926424 RepID=UPI001FF2D401|nr:ComF family protein [Alcanivorax sp. S6407]MCK0153562.1 ComF family protein [Alcanivorax sp. S6407]
MAPVNLETATKVYRRLKIDQFMPCLLCGFRNANPVCHGCVSLLQPMNSRQCRCGLPFSAAPALTDTDSPPLCGRCIRRPPGFVASTALYPYQFPLDMLIQGFKYQGKLVNERALQQLLLHAELPWPECDLLCPLPVHWFRRWQRGFDQGERLARLLGQHWHLPVVTALARRRATPHQQGLTRSQRQRNLRRAFQCQTDVRQRHVLLVDDVMTTGSTAREASRALLDAGAASVRVWCLARTL